MTSFVILTATAANLDSSNNLTVAPVAGEAHIGSVGGNTVLIQTAMTRTADTNTYTAGDAVTTATSSAAAFTFVNCARANAGSGMIVAAILLDSANVATKGSFELWLFAGTAQIGVDNDNAVFTPTDAELANLVAIIPFTTAYVGDATVGAGGNAIYLYDGVNRPFVCGASTRNLFGVLVVRNAYVPVASEIFTVTLQIAQD